MLFRSPPQQVLTVTVMTVRDNRHDATCILNPGDHDFIKHKSFVVYATCKIEFASRLIQGVSNGEFSDRGLLREEIFDHIVSGMAKSKAIKPFARQFFSDSN